jgi:HD-GYP domain-containing protein (c-di-GMP phosphodiesterase class II)
MTTEGILTLAPAHAARLSPGAVELVEAFERRRPEPLAGREAKVEATIGTALVAAGAAMALLLPWNRPLLVLPAVVLVVAFAVTSRVRFAAGNAFTEPTALVLVPMLFLVPAAAVPLLVALALVLANVPDYVSGRRHPDRAVSAMADAWYSVGPALVLAVAGSGAPVWSDWPVYLVALAALIGVDFAVTALRERLALGVSTRMQLREVGWVYATDVLLAPAGFLAALAAADQPYAFLAGLPLVALLALFAQERAARIDGAVELSAAYRGTAMLLGDVVEADDAYTGDHSRGVVALAVAVADAMRLDPRERRNVEFGALLHDVGKIAIPKEIINKPGPLTDEEWTVVRAHTVEGQRMLNRVGGVLAEVGRVVRSSHERWDGGGYPDGLAGDEIPVAACVVAACDAFNAMTTDRSYRAAMPVDEAVEEMRRNAGTQFSPAVVDALVRLV